MFLINGTYSVANGVPKRNESFTPLEARSFQEAFYFLENRISDTGGISKKTIYVGISTGAILALMLAEKYGIDGKHLCLINPRLPKGWSGPLPGAALAILKGVMKGWIHGSAYSMPSAEATKKYFGEDMSLGPKHWGLILNGAFPPALPIPFGTTIFFLGDEKDGVFGDPSWKTLTKLKKLGCRIIPYSGTSHCDIKNALAQIK